MENRARFGPVYLVAQLGLMLLLALCLQPAPAAEERKGDSKANSWRMLFDGKSLRQWKVIEDFDFKRHGKVRVADGTILLEKGKPATGIRWTGEFPRNDFEVTLEAKRVEGDDFFCAMSFHWNDSPLTLVMGGWDGSVVGLSSIDDEPAVENETCDYIDFEQNRWYRIRLRVTQPRIQAWLDDKMIVDFETKDRKLSIYWEMEPCLPFGFATWYTTGALREIKVRSLHAK
jgi:hypothetical protein